jgi:hypothetical protein
MKDNNGKDKRICRRKHIKKAQTAHNRTVYAPPPVGGSGVAVG